MFTVYILFKNIFMNFAKSTGFSEAKMKRLEGKSNFIERKQRKKHDNALKQQICDYNGDVRLHCKVCLMD